MRVAAPLKSNATALPGSAPSTMVSATSELQCRLPIPRIRPQLRSVRGVTEVNTIGGYEKQYQIRINPNLLIKFNLTFDEVVKAVEDNNRNVGAGNVREGTRSVLVQGLGRTTNVDQIKGIVIAARHGVPIRER